MTSAAVKIPCLAMALAVLSPGQKAKEKNRMQHELRVSVRVQSAGDRLEIEYWFENPSAQPVLVFDRMWNMQANGLEPNWAYVEVHDGRAEVRRLMEQLPQGLRHESPTVPYGREIGPMARGSGKFSLALPLKQHGEYDAFRYQGAHFQPTPVHEVTFSMGWCLKPGQLPPGIQSVEMQGEKLWLLPYSLVAAIQLSATAPAVRVDAMGEVRR
jgi:hypothetical protein